MHSYLNLENRGWIQKLPGHVNQKIASFLQSKDQEGKCRFCRQTCMRTMILAVEL